MVSRAHPTRKSEARAAFLVILLASMGTSGCYADANCTPADTTHSCCVKNNPKKPEACDGIEGEGGTAFRSSSTPQQVKTSSGKGPMIAVATVATAAAAGTAAVLVNMSDAVQFKKLQAELDRVMEECVDLADRIIDSRRPKGEILDSVRCNEEVGRDANGKRVTRAMQLGNEKHQEASSCVEEKLSRLIEGQFSIEQRYQYNPSTKKLRRVSTEEEQRLIRQGRKHELRGTLKPDVVIHSGDPTQARLVYDFKFPCGDDKPPTWRIYEQGPYRDKTQGRIYENAFGVQPGRVAPGRKGVIR
ncbi:hypothetical protein D187_000324 [Cystobacter fuscus DSM 2262]|uniref:Lipoprotein n=1 Tax=Cystobacter fuscus (strain ATCC 25194 / DSM 2262 / NBRC 100088 / M29) TaxID=1242864 RepID=S9PPC8_CYSF2|nr:hypothetical protein D187_000324 [Cystobacter fuscus DSM 2262]